MPRLQRGLWQAAAVAVAAHAALLTQLPALRPAAPWGQGGPEVRPFQMRMIPLPSAAEALAPAPAAPEISAPTLHLEAKAPAAEAARPASPRTGPAPAAGVPSGAPSPFEAPYLARDQLTVAPQPLTDVDVVFPQDVAGIVDLHIKVSLFVDEQGVVRHVLLESPDIPPAFARAVIETFMNTRFSPGKVDTMAVRSRVRMEVEFRAPGAARPSGADSLSAPARRSVPPSVLVPTSPSS